MNKLLLNLQKLDMKKFKTGMVTIHKACIGVPTESNQFVLFKDPIVLTRLMKKVFAHHSLISVN